MFVFEHASKVIHMYLSIVLSWNKGFNQLASTGKKLTIDLNMAGLSADQNSMDIVEQLSLPHEDYSVYRRSFTKADGRMLYLYGYNRHDLAPINQVPDEISKGGELRWHPLRQEWNIYAPHRQNRTFKPIAADDPLAPSRPGAVPTEIPFSDFELAVFENKFTSLHEDAPQAQIKPGVRSGRANGHCDVIVYGPQASGNLHTIGQDKRRLLVAAWIDRYDTLFRKGHKFVLPFENRGDAVGVTLHHPHGQIYAFPFIPDVQKRAAEAFESGFDLSNLMKEVKDDLEVASAGGVSAFCPPFARFPYEIWIAPQSRRSGPWDMTTDEVDGFAELLGDITRRYDTFFERPTPYMLNLHAAPAGHEDHFHFTAQFYPLLRSKNRVKYLASVEQSTGVFTVDVMPDAAAKTLRSI